MAQCQVKYGKYFTSLSCFANLLYELLGESNKNKIWEMTNFFAKTARVYHKITSLSLTSIRYSTFLLRKLFIKISMFQTH